jgi:hypothetical protein
MNKISNIDLLNTIFNKCKNGSLLEEYDSINRDTRINFICDTCKNKDSKLFERIIVYLW